MKTQFNDPLLLAGKVLTILAQAMTVLAGAAIAIAFGAVAFFSDKIQAEIQADHAATLTEFPTIPMLSILTIAIAIAGVAFFFFGKLRQIINTVGEGDPFVPENADRLSFMAWAMLGIYLLASLAALVSVTVAEWARQIEDADFSAALGFDLTSILFVVILFILARVFRHGAAMREDLEGTV